MSETVEQRLPSYVVNPAAATEAAILRAARQLLWRHPGRRLTMEAIARASHISRTGLYGYFAGRDALTRRLMLDADEAIRSATAPYVELGGAPRADLHQSLRRVFTAVVEHRGVLWSSAAGTERSPAACAALLEHITRGAARRIVIDRSRFHAVAGPSATILAASLVGLTSQTLRRAAWAGEAERSEYLRTVAHVWWSAVYGER